MCAMNEKDLFDNYCFLPSWSDDDYKFQPLEEKEEKNDKIIPQRKDLATLLAELEEIKNNIEDIKAREWHLAKLIKLNKEGIAFQ